MIYGTAERTLALNFARTLSQKNYADAHAMCSTQLKSQVGIDNLREQFDNMIPADWGPVDPIEIAEQGDLPFIYVVLGGDTYTEAIIIDAFVNEDGMLKIDNFVFGRP